jgi:hypothetical protein
MGNCLRKLVRTQKMLSGSKWPGMSMLLKYISTASSSMPTPLSWGFLVNTSIRPSGLTATIGTVLLLLVTEGRTNAAAESSWVVGLLLWFANDVFSNGRIVAMDALLDDVWRECSACSRSSSPNNAPVAAPVAAPWISPWSKLWPCNSATDNCWHFSAFNSTVIYNKGGAVTAKQTGRGASIMPRTPIGRGASIVFCTCRRQKTMISALLLSSLIKRDFF